MLPNVPALLMEKLRSQYGPDLTEEIIAGFVRRPVTLRVNTIKSTPEAVGEALSRAGIAYEKAEVPSAKRDTVVKKDMSAEDIANAICYAANQPKGVVVEEMTVWGTSQQVQPL